MLSCHVGQAGLKLAVFLPQPLRAGLQVWATVTSWILISQMRILVQRVNGLPQVMYIAVDINKEGVQISSSPCPHYSLFYALLFFHHCFLPWVLPVCILKLSMSISGREIFILMIMVDVDLMLSVLEMVLCV